MDYVSFMKKEVLRLLLWCVPVAVMLLSGCSDNRRSSTETQAADEQYGDTTATDSLESIFGDSPVAKAADELFDDFVFNFAANRKLQLARINFPLPVKENGKERKMGKTEWKMDYFFMKQGYYSLIFDDEKQIEVVNDTAVNHVVLEKIFLSKNLVRQYDFKRINGLWMLTRVEETALSQNQNASFLSFYKRFSTDDAFQTRSLHVPVSIVLPDPNDDFNTMTADLYPEQWVDFKPQILPRDVVYNIIYGQTYKSKAKKLFVIRGIANGLETKMSFRNVNGKWQLTKLVKL